MSLKCLFFCRGSMKAASPSLDLFKATELFDDGAAWSGRGGPDGSGLASEYTLFSVYRSKAYAASAQIRHQYRSTEPKDRARPKACSRRSRCAGLSIAYVAHRAALGRLCSGSLCGPAQARVKLAAHAQAAAAARHHQTRYAAASRCGRRDSVSGRQHYREQLAPSGKRWRAGARNPAREISHHAFGDC
jgi:hypothetical protein